MYLRLFAARLAESIFPETSMSIFMVSLLILVICVLRFGLVTLARLNEIVLPLLMIVFTAFLIMLLPYMKADFLTPVIYRSIIPVTGAGIMIAGNAAYFTFLFILGDSINNKEKIKKVGLQASLLFMVIHICLIIATVGTFSHTIIARSQLPFLIAVKQISLFNTLEKIESIVVAFWIASDFVLISFFALLVLYLMKSLFRLSDEKPSLSIFMVFIYFLALYLANSVFELEELSKNVVAPVNIFIGFIIPAAVLGIGKLRKKV